MPIQAPKEYPATQQVFESGWSDCTQSSAPAASAQLTRTMVELALAAANATEVEPQCRKAALLEHVEQIVDDSCCSWCRQIVGADGGRSQSEHFFPSKADIGPQDVPLVH